MEKIYGNWEPIANASHSFKGTFEGNNHTIDNLYINTSSNTAQGLFGINQGTIKNVIEETGSVTRVGTGAVGVGGICGTNSGTIQNCINKNVSVYCKLNAATGASAQSAGGICGGSNGIVEKCANMATIEGTTTYVSNMMVGGIAGYSSGQGQIKQSYNKGNITGSCARNTSVGGICGSLEAGGGTIQECYNTGTITGSETGSDYLNMGGILGHNRSTVTKCYNIGKLVKQANANSARIGSILGYQLGNSVTNCFYLSGTYSTGYGGKNASCSTPSTTAETAEQLKALASTLGDAFTDDIQENPLNDGYPILKWQIGEE